MADTIFYFPHIRQSQQLPEEESHHIVKVLRLKEGDTLTLADGKGYFFVCRIVQSHPKRCLVTIKEEKFKPRSWDFRLEIAFAPTKNMDRNEWFVEKATEIGINAIIPLKTLFSERKELKIERLEKIAVSAIKQSMQSFLPDVKEMTDFNTLVTRSFEGQKFIAHCYPIEKQPLAQAYQKGENALILIGPEGDFSEEEVQTALNNGFQSVSLGNNRLRTETACLTACHTLHVIHQM